MWKLTEFAATRWPLAGVPWRDMTDEEFAAAAAAYAERNQFPPDALAKSGLFEHVEDAPAQRHKEERR